MSVNSKSTNDKRYGIYYILSLMMFMMFFSLKDADYIKAAKEKHIIPTIGIRSMSYFDKDNNLISRNYIVRTNKKGTKYDKSKVDFQLWYRSKGGKWKKLTKTSSVVSRQIPLKESTRDMEYKLRLFKKEDGKRVYGRFSKTLKVPASPKIIVSRQSDGIHIKIENLVMKDKYHTYLPDSALKQKINEWKISFYGENGTYAYVSSLVNNDKASKYRGEDASFEDFPVMCRSSKDTSSYEYAGMSRQLSKSSIEYIIPADSTVAKAIDECKVLNIVSLSVTIDMEAVINQPVYTVWDL